MAKDLQLTGSSCIHLCNCDGYRNIGIFGQIAEKSILIILLCPGSVILRSCYCLDVVRSTRKGGRFLCKEKSKLPFFCVNG